MTKDILMRIVIIGAVVGLVASISGIALAHFFPLIFNPSLVAVAAGSIAGVVCVAWTNPTGKKSS